MNKVVEMKQNDQKHLDNFISAVATPKKTFIPPKQKMKESIENDAKYLMALGGFIQEAQKRVEQLIKNKELFEASKLNVEIMEAIGKYQANEGLVQDKQTHYEKVFLPMYEKEMEESKEKFDELYSKVEVMIDAESKNDEMKKIQGFLKKEIEEYNSSDSKDNQEFKNYMYKIFKRLVNKQEEIIAIK
jgi:hypothetical protein